MGEFAYRSIDGRWVLKSDSTLRMEGRKYGLPVSLWEWLCGDDIEHSASEVGILFTKDFFQKEV
ncbi:hypothetical protein M011DRAFT_465781 [Sporormia fimetaria CBS 119925]|uniref:Uncharacterized protein n=1 Tax=Sporormia fimetaria CBS 119925 TaxID=1340428 RepID=A0A6A6VFK7_9PLEO|nr:hypothetical protein M011DRAFT_465781 [Sporormia fimetaria CBS 119925]